ncbi:MAG: glucose-6-phosphate isomerase, partial [Bacillota bacterium]|nr:glucose-6-phosphate isomerase [Bacillota bacterium]
MIKFDNSNAMGFIDSLDFDGAYKALDTVLNGTGAGSEYTGWVKLPKDYDKEEYDRIKKCADKIYKKADALVVIGIGGSYLGARAVIEFLLSQRYNETLRKGPKIYFVGNGISGEDLSQVLELIGGKSIYVNVISKSGTTLEPALAFRIFKKYLEETYGKEGAKERIICTTDKKKGALKSL